MHLLKGHDHFVREAVTADSTHTDHREVLILRGDDIAGQREARQAGVSIGWEGARHVVTPSAKLRWNKLLITDERLDRYHGGA